MTTRHRIITIIFIGLVIATVWLAPPMGQFPTQSKEYLAHSQAAFARGTVTLNSTTLEVDLALDERAWEQGMMHRKDWGNVQGMLFVFPKETIQSFWMQNTYLPLDIIFINQQLQIVTIVENATPLSTNNIDSIQPAQYVLEIPAGAAKEYQLQVGETITWSTQ